jgi:hypothetical protein
MAFTVLDRLPRLFFVEIPAKIPAVGEERILQPHDVQRGVLDF